MPLASRMSAAMIPPPPVLRLAQVVGITAPAVYSSLTFAYSYMVVPPLVDNAPEDLLAKQWLQAYQYAASFVPPLIISGTVSNALLAYLSPHASLKVIYASAALMVWSIIPVTLFYFEPNINGAGKWKVQRILQKEGHYMKEQEGKLPSPFVHTARPEARKWAEGVGLKHIANRWAQLNAQRYHVTALAVVASAAASCTWGGDLL